MLYMESDERLVSVVMSDDPEAMDTLVKHYIKPVYGFVYRLVGHRQDAEDVTQETFLKAWKQRKRYRRGESFAAWLFAIARNTAIDWLRKKKQIVFSDFDTPEGENVLLDTVADTAPLPDVLYEHIEEKERVQRLLATLSPLHREVLLLHYNEGLSFREIGLVLGKSLNTVKSQHRRALLALRDLLHAP